MPVIILSALLFFTLAALIFVVVLYTKELKKSATLRQRLAKNENIEITTETHI